MLLKKERIEKFCNKLYMIVPVFCHRMSGIFRWKENRNKKNMY